MGMGRQGSRATWQTGIILWDSLAKCEVRTRWACRGACFATGVLDLDGGKAFGLAILVIKIVLCLFSHGIYGADGKIIRREL